MSVQYNGTSESSVIANIDKMCGAGQWTTTVNINLNALPAAASVGFIISKSNNGAAPFVFELGVLDSGLVRITFDNAGIFGTATGAIVLTTATNYHIAAVFHGSGGTDATRWQLYVNGVADTLTFGGAASVANLSSATGIDAEIGMRNSTNFLSGFVEEIRMWERAFSPQDVKNDQIRSIPDYLESLRLWCPFDSKDDTISYGATDGVITHSTASANGSSISTQTVGTQSYIHSRRRRRGVQKRITTFAFPQEHLRPQR